MEAHAQNSGLQLWQEYDMNMPFAENYLFEIKTGYRTVLQGEDKWRTLSLAPTLEWNALLWMDLLLDVSSYYTVQTDTVDTWEIRSAPAIRFTITEDHRIELSTTAKWESRYMKYRSESTWDHSNRLRIKGEGKARLGPRKRTNEKSWYAKAETEIFFVIDEDLSERYANRVRVSLGMGYRLNYKFRFEVTYIFQESRNKLFSGATVTDDNIVRLRFKHYVR